MWCFIRPVSSVGCQCGALSRCIALLLFFSLPTSSVSPFYSDTKIQSWPHYCVVGNITMVYFGKSLCVVVSDQLISIWTSVIVTICLKESFYLSFSSVTGGNLLLSSVYQPVLFLSVLTLHSPILDVINSIFLAAEGPTYPLWLISIPSDPLVYPSPSFWCLTRVGNDFSPLRPFLSNLLLVVGGRHRERSSFSFPYGKQTNNYCPDDHLHNSNTTFNMLSSPSLKHLVHERSLWKSTLLNVKLVF